MSGVRMGGAGDLPPVVVVEGEQERRTAPVVVLPGGARIEGLDLAALAEFVRRLG